uniref:Omega-conotoxin-like Vn2 n=1 Tax=Conus ventricosus TaxID=117992 RepID=U6VN_CONVE|nr:RecName: Full=Omega-conotoxin-like Vn2; AltName: Full=Conotoxin Vn2; AltName: Full=Conotoxin-Vn; AltName: Full=Vn6A [Conus ventricosus]
EDCIAVGQLCVFWNIGRPCCSGLCVFACTVKLP